ncbi:MAG: phosphate ABC transporter permease subunit PstC [Chthoniobacterales bacterium]
MSGTTASNEKKEIARYRSVPDLFRVLCWVASVLTVVILAWIGYEIFSQAWPAIKKFGLNFITGTAWTPGRQVFGVLPFLIGTAASSVIALLIAFPLGISIAIFLSEDFLPVSIRQAIRFVVELLASIPSVVYGLWGIFVVVPLVQQYGTILSKYLGFIPLFEGPAFGNSLLTASIVLALMVLPTITAISRNAFVSTPATLREGAYALGATRWEAILGVIFPAAAPGVVAATILAFGRAMGETMAVAMLIGNSPRLTWSLLSPSGTLAGLLANQFAEADGMQINALMYAALLLVILTLGVNMLGEVVLRYTQKRTAGIN